MATWTVSAFDLTCGSCGGGIPAGQPMQLLTVKRLVRCVQHATGPVNEPEVDLERARIDIEREREAMQRPSTGGGAEVRIPRRPRPFKSLGEMFDPRAAAAGKDA